MKITLSIIFSMCCLLISAQSQDISKIKDHQLKVNLILGPSVEYEFGISDKVSLGFQVGIELGSLEQEVTGDQKIALIPSIDIYSRYYYNLEKRIAKNKVTSNNAGNYIGLTSLFANADWVISDLETTEKYFIQTGAVWGLQRTYWKKLSFNLEFGIGYAFSDIQGQVVPIGGIHLGWVLF